MPSRRHGGFNFIPLLELSDFSSCVFRPIRDLAVIMGDCTLFWLISLFNFPVLFQMSISQVNSPKTRLLAFVIE